MKEKEDALLQERHPSSLHLSCHSEQFLDLGLWAWARALQFAAGLLVMALP
jgi:hypothetical protein